MIKYKLLKEIINYKLLKMIFLSLLKFDESNFIFLFIKGIKSKIYLGDPGKQLFISDEK